MTKSLKSVFSQHLGRGMAAPLFALAGLLLATIAMTFSAQNHPALAHQQKAAITQVLFNPRTGNLEIAHRFYLHDVEHAMARLLNPAADIYLDPEVRQGFADYVVNHFSIRLSQDSKALPLKLVGFEDERAFFWVYQEIQAPQGAAALIVDSTAMRDIWKEQINTVNIEGYGALKTLTFSQSDGAQKVLLRDR